MPDVHEAAAAAHAPETAEVGAAILAAGGTAVDAAVAMTIAACVAEPLVVSLLSGMHGIAADQAGTVLGVDGFVDVPQQPDGGTLVHTHVDFGRARVPYTIGAGTFAVPALLPGCGALHRRMGRLPWAEVVRPARDLASRGATLTAAGAAMLAMLEPVMTIGEGADVFAPEGALLEAGHTIRLPSGVVALLDEIADRGGRTLNEGPVAAALAEAVADMGSTVTAADLASTGAELHTPPTAWLDGWRVTSRRGLSPLLDRVAALEGQRAGAANPVVQLARAAGPSPQRHTGTTTLAAADEHGGVCAITASLGLGTGTWFRGQQLNSMLGERDLVAGGVRPRHRMPSMMAPAVLRTAGGSRVAIGSAGGSRIPSAMLRTIDGLTRSGLSAVEAVDLPRLHREGDVVHVEPHMADEDVEALQQAGFRVSRWDVRQHFFGGISAAGAGGAEGDPRRGGVVCRP